MVYSPLLLLLMIEKPHLGRVDGCFGVLVSTCSFDEYELVLQELLATGVNDVNAIHALEVAFDISPRITEQKDMSFTIAKLLFGLTKNFLVTTSSDVFIGYL